MKIIQPIPGTKFDMNPENRRRMEYAKKLVKDNDDRRNIFNKLLIEELENEKNNIRNK